MTHSFLDVVLRGAEALAARDGVASLADPDLLRRFAADRDQAAFAVLVRRHGPLVWGVCRNLLPADADAEDAFQASFLALVRSAGTIRQTETLGGWLHAVAYRIAMKARRTAARRRKREAIAAIPEPDSPVPDAAWDDLQAAVHEEVCRLPDKLRIPFVLCGLQGRQQKDVAKQLGWKIGTVSGRLTQARQRLLDRLARRGVPVGMAAGAAVLGMASGTAAVPYSVSSKALAVVATPDAVSPVVISLARGVNPMYLTRTKMLVAGVLLAGALTTGIGSRLVSTADAQAPSSEPSPDAIKKALDYLRSQPSQDRWEYKFVRVDKTFTPSDLQKLLSASDRDGWEYCGTQELADAKAQIAAAPHMVFKRPRAAGVADADAHRAARAGLAALADAVDKADRAKANEEEAKRTAEAERYLRMVHEAQLQSAQDAVRKSGQLADDYDAKKKAAADATQKALAQERDRAALLERQIEQIRRQNDALMTRLKELEDTSKAGGNRATETAPTKTLALPLKHVKADAVLKVVQEVFPAGSFKAHIDTGSNTLTIHGSPDLLAKLKELVEKHIDAASADSTTPAAENPEIAVIPLKHIDAKTALDAIKKELEKSRKKFAVTIDSATNSLIVGGPADAVKDARKVVEVIDRAPGARK
jgi:RNA polymerase sigma factor (sigma-70 family)